MMSIAIANKWRLAVAKTEVKSEIKKRSKKTREIRSFTIISTQEQNADTIQTCKNFAIV